MTPTHQSTTTVTQTADDDAVSATRVTKRFGEVEVLRDIDLHVAAGTIQGMVGPSGSGKTTTVRLLTGLMDPSSGTVRVFGDDPRQLGTRGRARIGYMPQLGVLHPDLTVTDNLRYLASIYAVRDPRRRIDALLEEFGLAAAAGERLRNTSGGMQRRVALIGALLHDPELLFLDEPTAGLDPVLRHSVWSRLEDMRDRGVTIIVTTQIVTESTRCDRVALLVDGAVVAQDTPAQLRRRADGGDVVLLRTREDLAGDVVQGLGQLPEVVRAARDEGRRSVRLVVDDADSAVGVVTGWLDERGVDVAVAERQLSDFDDVFVALLEEHRDG